MEETRRTSISESFTRLLKEKNVKIFIIILYIVMCFWVASVPYDAMKWDKADATTNVIWTEYYSKGIYEVPFDEWHHKPTQSVVVMHNGEYVVVNEKGPGHVLLILPFYVSGMSLLFGPFMMGVAALSTYMLGRRLANWRVGAIACVLVMTNTIVVVMWHRFWWTDASTMHLLALSMWLIVEANYRINRNEGRGTSVGQRKLFSPVITGALLAFASGIVFGGAVSTRYPVALVIIAPVLFLLAYYIIRALPDLKTRALKKALVRSKNLPMILISFSLGLLIILAPLMSYNAEYFGGPFKSGYDATPVTEFNPDVGLSERNQSMVWTNNPGGMLDAILNNIVELTPVFLVKMPCLLFLPFGIYVFRRNTYLLLLLTWILVTFLTYMSLSWMSMYAQLNVVHEPRYFMPALPAIAILSAVAIDRISLGKRLAEDKPYNRENVGRNNTGNAAGNVTGKMFAFLIVLSLSLTGLIPVENHFQDIRKMNLNDRQPPPPGPTPAEYIKVNTDQLVQEPQRWKDIYVSIRSANITRVLYNGEMFWVRSNDSKIHTDVEVQMQGWSISDLNHIKCGLLVDVNGKFILEELQGKPLHFFVNVKNGTLDSVKPAK